MIEKMGSNETNEISSDFETTFTSVIVISTDGNTIQVSWSPVDSSLKNKKSNFRHEASANFNEPQTSQSK